MFFSTLLRHLKIFSMLIVITGVLYPLLLTIIAQVTMQHSADGSLIVHNNMIIGSVLIGQRFENPIYFWPRPSAMNYDPLHSGGSSFGPTSRLLKKAVEERKKRILSFHHCDEGKIPAELLFSSGSGLDPHISLETALFQAERIAFYRKRPHKEIEELVNRSLISGAYINVLLLNYALDKESSQ